MNKNDIPAWGNVFKNFYDIILELLYPNTCVLCGELSRDGICKECERKKLVIGEPRCMCCGKPIQSTEEEFCLDCLQHKKAFWQGRSLWVHKDLAKQSIYRFKYKNHRVYAREYAKLLVREHGSFLEQWKPECIVPIPIHWNRRRMRGYNQAEVLARAIQEEIRKQYKVQLPIYKKMIYRRETVYQKKLDHRQRRRNLENAFAVKKEIVLPKTVLVVDDIYTTGATIQAISKLMKKYNVERTMFFTISIGQGF